MKKFLWTSLKSRLQLVSTQEGKPFNWLFLPGGPGLGSESLNGLVSLLKLPGSIWRLDLPGDGSNLTTDDSSYFSSWSEALVEAVESLDNVILVAHSTGGMYVLATKKLEQLLMGLVLMDSAPDASWQTFFMEYVNQNPIANLEQLQDQYLTHPCNETLKQLTIASAPYLFTKSGFEKGVILLQQLPFNYKTSEWSTQHFDTHFKAQWIPQTIPTLIFAGDQDRITPLKLFTQLEAFKKDNILIKEITAAGHYPWIDNPDEVKLAFSEYCQML
ncbi:alpha/beta fold hydrolase [Legionella cardiaca]|uniref:Alpha/beta hydrolase n=1 Tax=Legionella cardiaca TaxID=1071983 RepID=A0ABY8AQL5_9GAMM|nr:alpha/beta hydrolase [Legionella cardiaca]WED41815.1 alpha/beta hydrolase [Legionella cardiaca]